MNSDPPAHAVVSEFKLIAGLHQRLSGLVEPRRLRRQDFDWKRGVPGRAQAMKDVRIESFEALLETFTAGPNEIQAFVSAGPLLTDDRRLAEYFLSLERGGEPNLAALKGDVRLYVASE